MFHNLRLGNQEQHRPEARCELPSQATLEDGNFGECQGPRVFSEATYMHSPTILHEQHILQSYYIFSRGDFKTWTFAFDGEMRVVGGDLVGFKHLARLIERPNALLSSTELAYVEAPEGVQESCQQAKPDVILDAAGWKLLRKEIERLEALLAEEDNPQLEEELEKIKEYKRTARGFNGHLGMVATPRIKKASQSVANAIKRALEVIATAGLPKMAQHLAGCARSNNYHFSYHVETPPAWDVNWLPPAKRA